MVDGSDESRYRLPSYRSHGFVIQALKLERKSTNRRSDVGLIDSDPHPSFISPSSLPAVGTKDKPPQVSSSSSLHHEGEGDILPSPTVRGQSDPSRSQLEETIMTNKTRSPEAAEQEDISHLPERGGRTKRRGTLPHRRQMRDGGGQRKKKQRLRE